jgi:hypothetical protein
MPIKILISYIVLLFFTAIANASTIKVVTVDGIGSDIQIASRDAAQKALIAVVGSLMDTTTTLEKSTVIEDAVRRETSQLKSNIKEYSQGTIQNFEMLGHQKNGDLVTVNAKVSVRTEELVAAINQDSETKINIDNLRLSVQASVEDNQKNNQARILIDRVLKPIAEYEYTDFTVSKPVPAGEEIEKASIVQINPNKSAFVQSLKAKYGNEFRMRNIHRVIVSSSLNKSFLESARKTLSKISSEANIRATLSFVSNPVQMSGSSELSNENILLSLIRTGSLSSDDLVLISSEGVKEEVVIQSNLNSMDALNSRIGLKVNIFKGLKAELKNKSDALDLIIDSPKKARVTTKNLTLVLKNNQSNPVASYTCNYGSDSDCFAESIDYTGLAEGSSLDSFSDKPWRMLDVSSSNTMASLLDDSAPGFIIFFEKRFFNIYFYMPSTEWKSADSLSIKIGG